ncbi:hypothetical protein [Micromonospora zamorensis]
MQSEVASANGERSLSLRPRFPPAWSPPYFVWLLWRSRAKTNNPR